MSTSVNRAAAARVWFDDDNMWVQLKDGRQLSVPLTYFPRLLRATRKQRERYELSGGGIGIHWDSINEDISVAGLLAGRGDQTRAARIRAKVVSNT